ncbi:hypothetical protein DPMN_097359 [Dreissena polymorpha]|uniref:Uncharacterized protein n=1 Tax=Dreissena polymorpha TaxID=45954 RepID=A0A9D4LA58_DREPO|nr:hypothetical protein DPMN_097359 [Dreissena polymorpha]
MGENVGDKLKFVKRDAFARGFMAYAALSSRGTSVIRKIPKGTKELLKEIAARQSAVITDSLSWPGWTILKLTIMKKG